jgi:hypothetical protein
LRSGLKMALVIALAVLAVLVSYFWGVRISADRIAAAAAYWLQVSATLLGVMGGGVVAWGIFALERYEAERRAVQQKADMVNLISKNAMMALMGYMNWAVRATPNTGLEPADPPFEFLRSCFEELERLLMVPFGPILHLLDLMAVASEWRLNNGPDASKQGKGWKESGGWADRLFAAFEKLGVSFAGNVTSVTLHKSGAEFQEAVTEIMLDHLPDPWAED